jgi:F0F1-type ATP synthase membrane subunit b/b'
MQLISSEEEMDFFKQDKELTEIKKQLKRQEHWLSNLHTFSEDLRNYAVHLKNSHSEHKKELFNHISSLNEWIEHFNSNHIALKKEINQLRSDLRKTLRKDFEVYHKTLSSYITLKLNEERENKDDLKQEILEELRQGLSTIKESNVNNEDLENPINNVMHYDYNVELTNPEKELLSLLFNENKPLTYENMAEKLNKSINSVRVYMNSLKSKKDIIDEFKSPSGKKIFSIKNSELVKTLFNFN